MKIEQVTEATRSSSRTIDAAAAAAHRGAHAADARAARSETVAGQTLLVARDDDDGRIIGTLTLVLYRVSSGLKGRIEDVIVDESARGQGVGEALRARRCGARTRPAC